MQHYKKFVIALGLALGVGIFAFAFHMSHRTKHQSIVYYHPSLFTEHAAEIEKNIAGVTSSDQVKLEQVFGGVVSHHMPTTIPMLSEFYVKLRQTKNVKTFIILGPDHVDSGRGDITISKAEFATPFGPLKTNLKFVEALEKSGLVTHDEQPFERDHSIHTQLPFIKKVFPEATIVPIVFRSSTTNEFARAFGSILGQQLNSETFLVASVDFTHYLSESQARPIDELSANILREVNPLSAGLAEADSPQAMSAFIAALETKKANKTEEIAVYNTSDFSDNHDFTTGYVKGFWGIGPSVAGEVDP